MTAALAWLAGCSPPAKREDLIHEVLKEDQSFSPVLDKYREVVNRIQTYQRELALKRSTIEHSIAQLRKDLASTVASVNQKTEEAKKRMDPDRARIQLALSMANEQLRATQLQRASLGRSIAQLKKSLKSNETGWSQQERARQETQLGDMLRETVRLDQEIASMKEHVRLLKIKLLLIKL